MQNNSGRWGVNAPRHCAITRAQRWAIFGLICLVGASFALFVTIVFDAWVVMPFTGIELACVAFAFWWWDVHANDFEAIWVENGVLRVVRQSGKRRTVVCETQAAWAQFRREAKATGWGGRRRLVISSRGQAVTFGEHLNEAGVDACHQLLKEKVKTAWA